MLGFEISDIFFGRFVDQSEVHLTLVDKSSEEGVRNLETEQASPEPESPDQNSKTDSPELMVLEQSAEYPPGLSTIQEVVPSGT